MVTAVQNLRALAAGIQAFQDVRAGRDTQEFGVIEESGGAEFADRLTAANPWLSEDQAEVLERVLRSSVDTYSVIVNRGPGAVFLGIRDVLISTVSALADEDQTWETLDRGALFEVARIAHEMFSTDTKADRMWARDVELEYVRGTDLTLKLAHEARAFFDAAFSGDLERAVRVGDVVAARSVETFKTPDVPRQNEEAIGRRLFAAMLLIQMAGTLCAQITPDLCTMMDDRPIGGAILPDPLSSWGTPDVPNPKAPKGEDDE